MQEPTKEQLDNLNLNTEDRKLIWYCRQINYGRFEVVCAHGSPVFMEYVTQKIKLEEELKRER